jgi:protein dithiol:quinone oxidoreductase
MLRFLDQPRLPLALLFAVCAALLGFGLYLQHVKGIEPCPMCILQRYAFVVVALIALLGALHGPRGGMRRVYAALLVLVSLIGAGIAARQTWIQIYPPELAECGPGLEYMLDTFPLAEALPKIFRGSGDCSLVDWSFLGLSIANWSLLCFVLFVVIAIVALFRRNPRE